MTGAQETKPTPEWDRCCHVCWNRVYAIWLEEPRSDCPFGGHTNPHECPDAMTAARNAASFIKLRHFLQH